MNNPTVSTIQEAQTKPSFKKSQNKSKTNKMSKNASKRNLIITQNQPIIDQATVHKQNMQIAMQKAVHSLDNVDKTQLQQVKTAILQNNVNLYQTQIPVNSVFVKGKLNFISTSKYTWYSFLPLFLLEQYKSFSNIYYLLNAIAGYIYVVVSPISNVLPIIFVLIMAAIREIIEDSSRHRSDKFQNGILYNIIRNKQKQEIQSKDIKQGDILILKDKEECPCDSLLLYSELEGNMCYISTSSLDGEVNLKPRIPVITQKITEQSIVEILGTISTGVPCSNLQVFNGQFYNQNDYSTSYFKADNVLLRGIRIENTPQVYAAVIFTGKDTCIMQAQSKTDVKSSRMNQRIASLVFYQAIASLALMIIFPLIGASQNSYSLASYTTYSQQQQSFGMSFVQNLIIFFILLAYMLPVSLFCSLELTRLFNAIQLESDEKLRREDVTAWLKEQQKDTEKAQKKNGKQTQILNANPKLNDKALKKELKSSPFATESSYAYHAQVKNSISIENLLETNIIFSDKTGTLTKNQMLFHSLSNVHNKIVYLNELMIEAQKKSFQSKGVYNKQFDLEMLFQLALCNTVLVQKSKEKNKQHEEKLQAESPDEIAFVQASKTFGLQLLRRDAKQVLYSFSFNINNVSFEEKLMFKILAVIPFSSARKKMSIVLQEEGQVVNDANKKFVDCGVATEITVDNQNYAYFLPASIAQPGQMFVLTKGADSFMFPICKIDQQDLNRIKLNATDFSNLGLRTLAFASKQLDANDMQQWLNEWQAISQLNESDEKYSTHCKILEDGLRYTGLTAIEDELQDYLKETLTFLLQSGIKVWMLTGDKTETAISIAKSSGLSSLENRIFELTHEYFHKLRGAEEDKITQLLTMCMVEIRRCLSQEDRKNFNAHFDSLRLIRFSTHSKFYTYVLHPIKQFLSCKVLNQKFQQNSPTPITVVIDTSVFNLVKKYHLEHILLSMALYANSVVCCRLSPSEKSDIVKLAQQYAPALTTLAIGDGANDVPMIRSGHIGIGVAGKEGLHACNSADLTVPCFKYVKRLFSVYGRYNHIRNQELFEYAVEKNSILALMHIVYSVLNLYSVQTLIDSFLLLNFNMLITLFPILFQAMTEQDASPEELCNKQYSFNAFKNMDLRFRPSGLSLFLRMLRSVYYSIVLILVSYYTSANNLISDGSIDDINSQAYGVFIALLLATSIEFFLHQNFYSFFTLFSFVFMVVMVALCTWFGNFFSFFDEMLIGVPLQVQWNMHFWMQWILTGLVCSLPSMMFEIVKRLYVPSVSDVLRYQSRLNGCVDPRKIIRIVKPNEEKI